MGLGTLIYDMIPPSVGSLVLQAGPPGQLPAVLLGLVVLALVIAVGRLFLKIAWKLVLVALVVVGVLWLLGLFGLGVV
jgi:hypothetical protein